MLSGIKFEECFQVILHTALQRKREKATSKLPTTANKIERLLPVHFFIAAFVQVDGKKLCISLWAIFQNLSLYFRL